MRSVTRKFAMTSAIAVASLGAVAATMGTASADPTVTPKATDIVAVGSDTIQALDNGISSDRTGGYPGLSDGTGKFYSWDATGSSPITPKTGASSIARPNGSGAGITALNASDHNTIDIARSSRGPNTGSTDWFIPFATDGVGWASKTPTTTPTNSPTDTNGPKTLTSAELIGIYTCQYTTWASLPTHPTASTDTIKVYLPQTGSGTRSFFLKALGITASSEPCWQSYGPEENEGTDPVFNDPDVIFPYSLSHYIGQLNGKGGGNDLPGYLSPVRTLDTTAQITAGDWAVPSSTYSRSVYHVVRQSDWSDSVEGPRLKGLLGRNNGTAGGWLCGTAGQALVKSFGFHALGSGCGTPQAGI